MGDEIQYGIPKLPTPIYRIWLIRSGAMLLFCASIPFWGVLDKTATYALSGLLGVVFIAVFTHQTLRERKVLRLARRNNLNICATCCTPFHPNSVNFCEGCGRAISPRETQRQWRRAVLISMLNWVNPRPKSARIFPHWSIPLALGLFCFGFLFLRESMEDRIWPPNTQTIQTFTVPNSGNPPKTYQIPVQTHPPTAYIIVMSVIWLFILFGTPVYIMIRQHHITRMLKVAARHGFLLCERCAYPLPDITMGNCPECGRTFKKQVLRQRWYLASGPYLKQTADMSIPLGLDQLTEPGSDM